IDALFDGEATLEGVPARHARNLAEVHALWDTENVLPVVAMPEAHLLVTLRPDVVVDATMRRQIVVPDLRTLAPTAVGLGPGFTPGSNCHIAIETQWGNALGAVLLDRSTAAPAGGPPLLGSAGRERFVAAPRAGVWRTRATIGQRVRAGDVVG